LYYEHVPTGEDMSNLGIRHSSAFKDARLKCTILLAQFFVVQTRAVELLAHDQEL
jgi:hypothetical protein